MAATESTPEPLMPVPDRVAIETPQGDVVAGDVVDTEMIADADGIERWYIVEIDGSRFRAPASETERPSL